MKLFSPATSRAVLVGIAVLMEGISAMAGTNAPLPSPPLPAMKSPVDSFRALLVMPAADRKTQIATRSADVQKKLVEKIREYQSLTPDERELRLKTTELRWYLKPVMSSPATNRVAQLNIIPENLRQMVADRIEQWDKLAPSVQQLILTNQHGADYVVRISSLPPSPPLPGAKIRTAMTARFEKMFELTANEKEKVLSTLSDAERRQMEKTLEAFSKLTPMQRSQCQKAFSKFTGMSAGEKQEFLKNAQRWSEMSPAERQSWRELVSTAPRIPPLPHIARPPPLPPNPRQPVVTPS